VPPPQRSKDLDLSSVLRAQTSGDDKTYLFGRAVYLPGGKLGPRVQQAIQLLVLIRGGLRVTVGDTIHELEPGEAILLQPGIREFFRFRDGIESEHTWCQVDPHIVSRRDQRILKSAIGVHKASSAIHLLIAEGLAMRSHKNADLHHAMAALSRASLLRFAANARAGDRRDAALPLHPVLERALEIVAAHYAELHSAEDLARRVGISATQLRLLYRQVKGESPTDMIWRLKVEHAIQLIRSTGLTLGEIADSCGYANPFHLSRSVKRHTGYSPRSLRQGEWRRQNCV
jgi:AraC-like DNA-binding protein